ncbi:uncharacterized protein EDB91DRAFT_1271499 [Suillus paluster]|uniref:uncharacterized protein n=1 Tax=Suillus paluster TaxID=48578 RepID=UPI001B86C739|nr:uncharacterized protein EDB91DRAFT_1271499 [Suillus paluster]KAG1745022.1 hypothetical protein EDB91DRAFT_1271499 [Suillus paluster]
MGKQARRFNSESAIDANCDNAQTLADIVLTRLEVKTMKGTLPTNSCFDRILREGPSRVLCAHEEDQPCILCSMKASAASYVDPKPQALETKSIHLYLHQLQWRWETSDIHFRIPSSSSPSNARHSGLSQVHRSHSPGVVHVGQLGPTPSNQGWFRSLRRFWLIYEVVGGDYGTINNDTGELKVEGNIYDKSFQTSLNQQGLKINLSEYQPKKGAVDNNMIILSQGVKQEEFSLKPEVSIHNLASASFKAEFQFQGGKRGAVLVMHKPLQEYIPPGKVLMLVHKANELHGKYLVTKAFTCPGYYFYLSNKSREKAGLALTAREASVDWWTDVRAAFLRKAFDKTEQYRYTPLYALKHRSNGWFGRRCRGDEERVTEDDLWPDCMPPWQPLDEDGDEDPVWEEDVDEDFSRRSAVESSFPFA